MNKIVTLLRGHTSFNKTADNPGDSLPGIIDDS